MAVPNQSHPQSVTDGLSLPFPQLPVSLSGKRLGAALCLTISVTPRALSSRHPQVGCPVVADLLGLTSVLHSLRNPPMLAHTRVWFTANERGKPGGSPSMMPPCGPLLCAVPHNRGTPGQLGMWPTVANEVRTPQVLTALPPPGSWIRI